MKVNDCNQSYEKTAKKGVTFDVMEILERHQDSIDRLTSLVSKMNVKWTKKISHTSLDSIKTDPEAKIGVDNQISNL